MESGPTQQTTSARTASAVNGITGDKPKQSAHAKRRLQKKLKKEQEMQQQEGSQNQASTKEGAAVGTQQEAKNQLAASDQQTENSESQSQTGNPQQNQQKKGGRDSNRGKKGQGVAGQANKKEYFTVTKPNQDLQRNESSAVASSLAPSQSQEMRSDHSMKDESQLSNEAQINSQAQSSPNKNEEAKQSEIEEKQKGKKVFSRLTVDKLPQINFGRKNRTLTSTEKGFAGPSTEWFDEEVYNQPRHKANFDEANQHDYYFNSYSSHHIHEEMLKDTHRTTTYKNAIEGNKNDFKDKIVLDIGCGTGILSIFAARAGAKHVYAVDAAEIALFAKEIVKDNGLEDKITVIKGKMEEIEFPFGEGDVDIIISEWMGYFLLYESMLDCVLWARDKYLNKSTGKMLPDRAIMYLSAIEDSAFMGEKLNFWDNVYDVNMSCMTKGLFRDPIVDTVPAENIMSDECCILDLDLVKMKKEDVEFSNFYSLTMKYNDKVHAFVFWFDTVFSDLENPVVLTTSPYKKYTHWKQSVLYLEKPLRVQVGDTLYGSIAVRQDRKNFRELNIKMSFHMEPQSAKQPQGREQKPKHFIQQYKFK